MALLPAHELAALALTVGEAVAMAGATARYGPEIARAVVPLAKEERAALEPLTAAWLQSMTINLTPGEALALMLAITLGQRVAVMEMMRAEAKKVPT